jgi:hypothetical protein
MCYICSPIWDKSFYWHPLSTHNRDDVSGGGFFEGTHHQWSAKYRGLEFFELDEEWSSLDVISIVFCHYLISFILL